MQRSNEMTNNVLLSFIISHIDCVTLITKYVEESSTFCENVTTYQTRCQFHYLMRFRASTLFSSVLKARTEGLRFNKFNIIFAF